MMAFWPQSGIIGHSCANSGTGTCGGVQQIASGSSNSHSVGGINCHGQLVARGTDILQNLLKIINKLK
jgi:hypothetical protein